MANTTQNKNSKAKKPSQAKTSSGKNNKQTKAEQSTVSKQWAAIVLGCFTALFACLAFVEGESGWAVCHTFVFRVFGSCAYVLPFILLYITIICAKEQPQSKLISGVISSTGLFLFIDIAFHIFRNTAEYFISNEVSAQIIEAWKNGKNGGVVGAALGGLICKVLGKTGASIISVILLIGFILFTTGTTLAQLYNWVKKPVKKVSKITNEKFQERVNQQEELRAQREREREERKNRQPPALPDDSSSGKKSAPKINKPLDEPDMPVTSSSVSADATGLPKPITDNKDSLVPSLEVNEPQKEAEKPKPERKASQKKEKKNELSEEETFTPPKDEEKPASVGEYVLPSFELLDKRETTGVINPELEMREGAKKLVDTLASFKVGATVSNICRGPAVTRYELVPDVGVRINKITSLSDDLALRLAAESVRVEAPIPGKSAIGIEVPNSEKTMVSMREIIDTDEYRAGARKSKLNVALGKDITGRIITADLAKMPHLLVAGTTGSGKSVCLNSMIVSILCNATPDEVKLLMIDPKMVEFTVYNGIAHLAVPVVSNPRKAAGALGWAVSEMEKRYKQFAETGVRDFKGFNKLAESRDDLVKMYQIVIFIDELSDLMMAAPKEVEDSICRLAQMARAAGMHLVIATQRPSVDVITGIIKANIPSRIALYVSSQIDSRTILDQSGAEKLLGNGDMLFSPVGSFKPTRVQGCFISDEEVERIVGYIKKQRDADYNDEAEKEMDAKAAAMGGKSANNDDEEESDLDPMFNQAAETIVTTGKASTTYLQKKLKLGYARASRIMDQLEENGIVGPADGARPREILVSKQEWYERQALSENAPKTQKDEQLSFDTMPTSSSKEQSYEYDYEDEYDEDPAAEDIEDELDEKYAQNDEPVEEIEIEELPEDTSDDDFEEEPEEEYYEKDEYSSEPEEYEGFDEYTQDFADEEYSDYEETDEDEDESETEDDEDIEDELDDFDEDDGKDEEEIDDFDEDDTPVEMDLDFDDDDDDDDDIDDYFN